VVGNIHGKIEEFFQKLGSLQSKTSFSFAIVAGNLFADPKSATNEDVEAIQKLLDGRITVPLTTYFALGTHELPPKVAFKIDTSTGELCQNLFYLGKRATTKTSEGIRIASLGGEYDASEPPTTEPQEAKYTENDAKSLKGAHLVDILVTSDWPDGVRKGSKVEFDPNKQPHQQSCVADLALALKPRYHFSTSHDVFYEREPYFNVFEEDLDTFRLTRFLSLAEMGNQKKQKWIYAFSLDPVVADPTVLPAGATSCPLVSSSGQRKKRAALPDQGSYRFANNPSLRKSPHPHKRRRDHAPLAPSECFFCLSSPNVATHLITSIGESAYMTVAKGPLTTNTTFATLPFSAHMLIIPLSHTPMLSAIETDEERHSTGKEMELFVTSLNSMLRKNSPELGAVSWSISRASGVHGHWQWMPVSKELINKGLIEAAFRVEAENEKYPSFARRKINEVDEKENYFIVRTWKLPGATASDQSTHIDDHKSMALPLDSSFRFDVQFGRRVLAKLLELDERADWRQCGQEQKDEEADVEAFKQVFKEFDFTDQ
jgi:hypothetical protein